VRSDREGTSRASIGGLMEALLVRQASGEGHIRFSLYFHRTFRDKDEFRA